MAAVRAGRSHDELMGMGQAELDALYRDVELPGAIPVGDTLGTALVLPGRAIGRAAGTAVRRLFWQGKVFDPTSGTLKNKVSPFGIRAIRARVDVGDSWLDRGTRAVVLDYSRTSLVARFIRDEIREVGPGVWLGKVFVFRWHALDFTLRAGPDDAAVDLHGPGADRARPGRRAARPARGDERPPRHGGPRQRAGAVRPVRAPALRALRHPGGAGGRRRRRLRHAAVAVAGLARLPRRLRRPGRHDARRAGAARRRGPAPHLRPLPRLPAGRRPASSGWHGACGRRRRPTSTGSAARCGRSARSTPSTGRWSTTWAARAPPPAARGRSALRDRLVAFVAAERAAGRLVP